ncbi:MAG TPA: SBBP repeat-containing protein [Candidatus Tumulicola sp.]
MHRLHAASIAVSGAAALILAAGCSGAGSQSSPAAPPGPATAAAHLAISTQPAEFQGQLRPPSHPLKRGPGWLLPQAKSCKSKLFVSSYRLGYVSIYCTSGRNQAPIGQITAGIETPEGAATDKQGNFYVTNTNANTVTEYAPNTTTPAFTYSAGLTYPAGVTVDRQQNVYVSSLSPASVEVFPHRKNAPRLTIPSTQIPYPIDVALDKAGNVYVTSYTASFGNGVIIEYPPGSTQGTDLGILTATPGGIVVDKAGNIVTADQRLPGVLVFPPGATSPSLTFGTSEVDPDPVRMNRAETRAYVGDGIGNAVNVYAYPSGTLVNTIYDGIDGPFGLALDPAAPQ